MLKLVIEDGLGCEGSNVDLFRYIYKIRSLELIFHQVNKFLNDEMKTVQFKLNEDFVSQYLQTKIKLRYLSRQTGFLFVSNCKLSKHFSFP